ncbi:M14 family metallopeptidase [Flavimarina sp. Hel_I_48]|uniref:M14 family metallopeptidase n=1 Tax=Flavimarina sp. Hel_I_48 TaxID=1392488 RepID=UPI0004DECE86|nr:M14 family metallopeptidase [Flavimarina sp. Hel_I_48]
MKQFFTFSLLLLVSFSPLFSQLQPPTLDYYLPSDVSYNPEIPKPQELLGWVPGTWHVSHDKLVDYMRKIAEVSDRISIEYRGKTFEGRPLLLLTITSPENHSNIEEIRKNHVALTEKDAASQNTSEMPIVTYQGMSIHGNEPSGANAGLLVAYYLAAAEGPEMDKLLDNTVILFDPSFNPDGLQRFAYWANTNKSQNINPDPQDREYDEVWPGGRTNHYWFDMNRDWLPVQLPESRVRIETFHSWYPNILTDHHEMGSNSSFFFQPGIQSRTNPLTPILNQELTKEIGNYHAAAFDKLGSLYYTEEDYDDFYYGKGSTFPDVNGSIGILFEQASSRGHAQETDNGILTFPFTIRNQFTAFLSTLEAAKNMRVKLLDYQRNFFSNARKEAGNNAYAFGSANDPARAYHLAEILKRQHIDVYESETDFEEEDTQFEKGSSYVVPKNQKFSRLLQAMFQEDKTFTDSLFYDISAWSFPLAFNIDFTDKANVSRAATKIENLKLPPVPEVGNATYGYLVNWGDYYAPKVLNKILDKGLRAKVAMQPFTLEGNDYDYGTVFVPLQNQEMNLQEMQQFMNELSQNSAVRITGVNSGLTGKGIDLGSRLFEALKPQKVALIVGEGISPYDAGEIWHLFDTRYDMRITKLDTRNFSRTDLSKYTAIILPNSYGSALGENDTKNLKTWIQNGGKLIAFKNSVNYLKQNDLVSFQLKETKNPAKNVTFEQKDDFDGAQYIGGAIFKANIDRSHPVNFGYDKEELNLFRDTTIFIENDSTSYKNPIRYSENPLAAGYISDINLDALKDSRPFVQESLGRGQILYFTDNTNFRAFWYGTNKLLMNAIFFADEM